MNKILQNLVKTGEKKLEITKIPESEFKNLDAKIDKLAKELLIKLKKKKLFLATMESCTGGGLINAITNIPGASEVIKGGLVTYSDQEKIAHGIPKKLIEKYTVYSPQITIAMASQVIREIKGTQIGIGITGILSKPDPRYPFKKPGQAIIGVIIKEKNIRPRPSDSGSLKLTSSIYSNSVLFSEFFKFRNNKILVRKIYFPSKKNRKKAKAIIILKSLEMIKEII